MQTYQSTPDYYRDYIEHGWLKDQAAKVHKYIKRWRNKAGKWVYQYKKPKDGRTTYIQIDERENEKGYPSSRTRGDQVYGIRNARNGWSTFYDIKGLSDHGNSRSYSKQGRDRGITAGRKRAAAKGHNVKGYSGNLSSRGYANSRTDFNSLKSYKGKTTRGGQAMKNSLEQKSRGVANRNRIKNSRALLKYKPDGKSLTRESVGAREQRIKRIHEEEMTLRAKGWTSRNGILVPPTKNAMMSDPRYKKSKKRRAK